MQRGRNIKPTWHFGGGGLIMVLGRLSPKGAAQLYCLNGRLNGKMYCKLLQSHLKTLEEVNKGESKIVFQQGNTSAHTSWIA
jgi:hypothetical protein